MNIKFDLSKIKPVDLNKLKAEFKKERALKLNGYIALLGKYKEGDPRRERILKSINSYS